jgi:hypothetical protein
MLIRRFSVVSELGLVLGDIRPIESPSLTHLYFALRLFPFN